MKNTILYPLSFILLLGCSTDSSIIESNNPSFNSSNGLRSSDVNYEVFEEYLNATYATSPQKTAHTVKHTFSFTHVNGFISPSEMTNIENQVLTIIGDNVTPNVIDIDAYSNEVQVTEAFEIVYNESFPDNLRPTGGIAFNAGFISGTYCDNVTDPLGGGNGRVARTYFETLSIPSGILHYRNVRRYELIGACDYNYDDEDWNSFGRLSVHTAGLWKYVGNQECTNDLLCLDAVDLNQQLAETIQAINQDLPQGYEVIELQSAIYSVYLTSKAYWLWNLQVGIPVFSVSPG